MHSVARFDWRSDAYRDAFLTLLRCSSERKDLVPYLEKWLPSQAPKAIGIDWGAGSGDLAKLLLKHCARTFVVEPSQSMRAELKAQCPAALLLDGDLSTAVPPEPIDFGFLSHVLYHTPDASWKSTVIRLAGFLNIGGCLLVTLKKSTSGCNDMLSHFGAPRFDLRSRLESIPQSNSDLTIRFDHLPVSISTDSYKDTETIARFMLCDRSEETFPELPSEKAFQSYVRDHFWDAAAGCGGWDCGLDICLVSRNREANIKPG